MGIFQLFFKTCLFDEAVLDRYDCVVVVSEFPDTAVDEVKNLHLLELALVWDNEVKDKIRMRRAVNHSEIMHRKRRVNLLYNVSKLHAHLVYSFVIDNNGVEVYHYFDFVFELYVAFNAVYSIVACHNIVRRGHFRMSRGKNSTRTVVVNNQVVHAYNTVRLQNFFGYFIVLWMQFIYIIY